MREELHDFNWALNLLRSGKRVRRKSESKVYYYKDRGTENYIKSVERYPHAEGKDRTPWIRDETIHAFEYHQSVALDWKGI